MARSLECTGWCAQKVLDGNDIVREAMLRQQRVGFSPRCRPTDQKPRLGSTSTSLLFPPARTFFRCSTLLTGGIMKGFHGGESHVQALLLYKANTDCVHRIGGRLADWRCSLRGG